MGSVPSQPLTVPGLAWPPLSTDVSPAHSPHRLFPRAGPFLEGSLSAPGPPTVWAAEGGAKGWSKEWGEKHGPQFPRVVRAGLRSPVCRAGSCSEHARGHSRLTSWIWFMFGCSGQRHLGVCRRGLSPPTLPPGQSLVLGSGIFVARSQGASGLELSRWPVSAAGGPSEQIPAEQKTPTPPS